jgi:hypothetical protein
MARTRAYSDDQIVAALKKKKGLVYHAADAIGCNPDTIYERAKTSPAVADAIRTARGKVVDTAEEKLFEGVEAGEQWAVVFALKNLGKDRGYYEKSEVEHSGRNRLVIEEQEYTGDGGDGQPGGPAAPGAAGVPPQ